LLALIFFSIFLYTELYKIWNNLLLDDCSSVYVPNIIAAVTAIQQKNMNQMINAGPLDDDCWRLIG
jgi:hypothetical protein